MTRGNNSLILSQSLKRKTIVPTVVQKKRFTTAIFPRRNKLARLPQVKNLSWAYICR